MARGCRRPIITLLIALAIFGENLSIADSSPALWLPSIRFVGCGEMCHPRRPCREGTRCHNGLCLPLLLHEGETCPGADFEPGCPKQCRKYHTCHKGKCMLSQRCGDTCEPTGGTCIGGLSCISGRCGCHAPSTCKEFSCVKTGLECNEPCDHARICKSSLSCVDGVCTPVARFDGAACIKSCSGCVEGLACVNNVCQRLDSKCRKRK